MRLGLCVKQTTKKSNYVYTLMAVENTFNTVERCVFFANIYSFLDGHNIQCIKL